MKLPFFCSFSILLTIAFWVSAVGGTEERSVLSSSDDGIETFDDLDIAPPENAPGGTEAGGDGRPAAPTPVKETPAKKSGFSLEGLLGLEGKKPAEKTPKDQTPLPQVPRYRIEEVIPDFALLILRVTTVNEFNAKGKDILSELNLGAFGGPLEWLSFSAYGGALKYVDRKRQATVVYIPVGNVPRAMLILPMKDYRGFIEALGADVSRLDRVVPEGYVTRLQKPAGWIAYPRKGYAVVLESIPLNICDRLLQTPSFRANGLYTPSAMKNPDLSLEITPLGVQHFVGLGNAALNDFSPIFAQTMKNLKLKDPELDFAEVYFNKANKLIEWVNANVQSLRIDLCVLRGTCVLSGTVLPQENSELFLSVQDPFTPQVATTLDMDSFLKVVPDDAAPLSGQMDITPTMVKKLGAPYNRVRHVEYSFALPAQNEFLAESWCFLLEVDDSEKFVREIIVPNAQKIGSFIGSEKVAEIGAQVFGNIAVRRQQRQMSRRRPPNNLVDPQAAAERGERLGAMLGGLIGKSAGEKQGLKTVDFDGYSMYVSDLVFFTEQMKRIRAAEAGELPSKKPIQLTGEFTLIKLLTGSLDGLINGDINLNVQDKYPTQNMMARRNCIVVLDPTHLLIVPGNENVLHTAIAKWNRIRERYDFQPEQASPPDSEQPQPGGYYGSPEYVPEPPLGQSRKKSVFRTAAYAPNASSRDVSWVGQWETIYDRVDSPNRHHLRSATLLDLAKAQVLADYIRRYYVAQLPQAKLAPLPQDTPALLSITTTIQDYSCFYGAIPMETIRNIVQASLTAKNTER